MIRCVLMMSLVLGLVIPASLLADEDGFRPLFNGRDLSGWVPVTTHPTTWSVQDGMLVCSGRPTGELRTDRMYQNFIIELEWRHMVPRGNAGIFVWADDITSRGVPFHRSVEVQVLENAYGNTRGYTTHGDIFPIHGATMTPINGRGGSRAFPTENRSKPSPEWNHYRIVCQDGDVSLAVNGSVVTRGQAASPRKGYLCIESEGGVVHYRNVRIKELPDTPVEPEHVAIADRGYRCLYTGVDLSGWTTSEVGADRWHSRDWLLAYEGNAANDPAPLTSEASLKDFGFIIDVQLREESGVVRIEPRGHREAAVAFDRADPQIGPLLEANGRWNRIEGSIVGDRLNLTINGRPAIQDASIAGIPAEGPLRLAPAGPANFANIFVRDIQEAP